MKTTLSQSVANKKDEFLRKGKNKNCLKVNENAPQERSENC